MSPIQGLGTRGGHNAQYPMNGTRGRGVIKGNKEKQRVTKIFQKIFTLELDTFSNLSDTIPNIQ